MERGTANGRGRSGRPDDHRRVRAVYRMGKITVGPREPAKNARRTDTLSQAPRPGKKTNGQATIEGNDYDARFRSVAGGRRAERNWLNLCISSSLNEFVSRR